MLPRHATPRTPGRPTDGAAGAFVAYLHGRPWLPWQRLTADVAGERLPSGRYAYPIFLALVPRQCGKTVWAHDDTLGRMLEQRDFRAAYAAQTGHVTTERYVERFEELEAGPLAEFVKLRRSQGTERITVPSTRSYMKAFPPKDGALRSSALDRVIVDEAQEHDEVLGRALDTTILPTFTTRPRRQLVIPGTAGTDRSAYLARYREQALAGVPGFGIVEYGALEGEDTDDEEVWKLRHPGLAGGLTDLDALRTARAALGRAGFAREYMNVWTRTATSVINAEDYRAVLTTEPMPDGRICFAVDVAADRSEAVIAACGPDRFLEVIDVLPDAASAARRVLELCARWNAPVVADRVGPTGTVHDDLQLAVTAGDLREDQLITPTAQDVANAAGDFLDDIHHRALTIKAHPAVDAAVEVAALRDLGDGKAWTRRGSAGSIAALVAITNAAWGYSRLPATPRKPVARG